MVDDAQCSFLLKCALRISFNARLQAASTNPLELTGSYKLICHQWHRLSIIDSNCRDQKLKRTSRSNTRLGKDISSILYASRSSFLLVSHHS